MKAATGSNVQVCATDRPRARRPWLVLAVTAALVAGCAAISSATPRALPSGASEAEVLATMGKPTGRYTFTEGGYRLEFARGPQGRETWMIDFDAAGRMVDSEQVMDLWYLSRVTPGLDTQDVLVRVGHPGSIRPIPRQQLSVWSYRYPTFDCLWYQISIGDDGKVISGSPGIDPQCDAGGMRAGVSR
jgi:hypothetical protein